MGQRSMKGSPEARKLMVLTGVACALAALAYLLLLRSGPDPESEPVSSPDPLAQAEASEDPFEPRAGTKATGPVETYEIFASRDPFAPVIENGSAGAGVDPEEGDSGQSGPGDKNQGVTGSSAPRANNQDVQGHTVKLVDVYREGGEGKAQVEVDANGYNLSIGQVFAENFQLVSTSGECATLLYGDDQFTLCEGEELLK